MYDSCAEPSDIMLPVLPPRRRGVAPCDLRMPGDIRRPAGAFNGSARPGRCRGDGSRAAVFSRIYGPPRPFLRFLDRRAANLNSRSSSGRTLTAMNTTLYRTRRMSLAMLTTAVIEANHALAAGGTSGPYYSPLLNLGCSLLHDARHPAHGVAPARANAGDTEFMQAKELSFVIPTYRLREVGETVKAYDDHFTRNGHSRHQGSSRLQRADEIGKDSLVVRSRSN